MVKKVEYIECDCKKGRIEVIANTATDGNKGWSDNKIEWSNTFFLICNKCDNVYKVNGHMYDCHPVFSHEDITLYKGKLTRQQIKEYIHNIKGEFKPKDEKSIIAKTKSNFIFKK